MAPRCMPSSVGNNGNRVTMPLARYGSSRNSTSKRSSSTTWPSASTIRECAGPCQSLRRCASVPGQRLGAETVLSARDLDSPVVLLRRYQHILGARPAVKSRRSSDLSTRRLLARQLSGVVNMPALHLHRFDRLAKIRRVLAFPAVLMLAAMVACAPSSAGRGGAMSRSRLAPSCLRLARSPALVPTSS